jgi:hypothetical protein
MKIVAGIAPLILAALAALFLAMGTETASLDSTAPVPALTAEAEQHILYGDRRGGGHLHGTGVPCKSEFPADWDADEVIDRVQAIAANDNLDWDKQDNGYYVAEQMVDDTRVRVVLNRDRSGVVTAYPTNVKRNPCPRAANDNRRE